MIDHSKQAAKFISNLQRAKWHNQALWFVREKRDKSIKNIPEWEDLRQSAKEIKDHTIEYLRFYLEEFEKNAKANGIEVLWAKDAKEHNKLIDSILFRYGIKRVVKSKSMLTEECGLNSYLQKKGYKVIDTDLGERIVQLAKESPSHIVLPAIHLKKAEVSEIFHKNLNSQKENTNPVYLTKVARENLRQEFLLAQAAITGVNFALAKEGGIVICTNEGNVDLGVSLPKIHIASMGIDKVIPSARELEVFTRILARSATGQEITTYTSHFLKPKPDGKMIVIIVDNGRSQILKEQKELLRCIRCGACMNTCPVFRRSGGHSYQVTIPGPIGSALEGLKDSYKAASLPFACTLCGSCDNVCPSKIPLHEILRKERSKAIQAPQYKGKKRGLKLLFWILKTSKRYKYALFLYKKFFLKLPRSILYGKFNKWGIGRELPTPAPKSFEEIMRQRRSSKD
jgi:L-lactate dehydrogenase complex protein LldF